MRFKFFLYTKEGQTLLANRGSYKTNIGAVTNEEVTKYFQKQAERGVNAAAEAMGFGKNFNSMNGNIAAKFVGTKWSNGKNFSERIWENADKLSQYLNNDIATGFARGVSFFDCVYMRVQNRP